MFKPSEVVVISTENKQLPFPAAKHIPQEYVSNFIDFVGKLKKYVPAKDDLEKPNSKKVIVIDSFTRALMMMSNWLEDVKKVRGYEFWRRYAKNIEALLMRSMETNKWLIWTALDDVTIDSEGETTRIVKVKGNEVKGLIESFFTIVPWTYVEKNQQDPKKRYKFITNSDGTNSAKTPIGMFDKQYIPNDIAYVIKKASEYHGFSPNDYSVKRPNILIVGKSGSGKSTSLRNLVTEEDVKREEKDAVTNTKKK